MSNNFVDARLAWCKTAAMKFATVLDWKVLFVAAFVLIVVIVIWAMN